MTREEAIKRLREYAQYSYGIWHNDEEDAKAFEMAIEALQTIDNCDQCEWCCPSDGIPTIHVVRCKECKHQDHCYQTVSHTKIHDGFQEHWSETIEWCSRGERKGGDDE